MPKCIVLIDSSSYTFYRVTATLSWVNRLHEKPENLEQKMEEQFWSCLNKFTKKIRVDPGKMFMVRDCPREEIWRNRIFPAYKGNRASTSEFGPHIKRLNDQTSSKFGHVIRVPHAEADDVIAVMCRLFSEVFPETEIIVVSGDSDLHQLLKFSKVKIYNPKGWESISCQDPDERLQTKIRKGDSSDHIPAGSTPENLLRNRVLIDLDYIPREIQDEIIRRLPHQLPGTDQIIPIPRNFEPRKIQLGLCCINTLLRKRDVYCSRTIQLRTIETKGLDELKRRAVENCKDLITLIKWNALNGIRVMRMSSDMFPHKSNTKIEGYTLDFAVKYLREAGRLARLYKQRLTYHPGQYNVVGARDEKVFQNTLRELDYHAEVLDLMECDYNSVMVVHGGGVYGDKEATINRWITNYSRLPERVRRRLVLENCEKSYSVADCLRISREIGIPVVLDTHHDECYRILHENHGLEPVETYIPEVLETWRKRGIKPKFHVSEQCLEAKIGKHSDLIENLPRYLLDIQEPIDIMIEAKLKEQAIFHLYEKYPELDPRQHLFRVQTPRIQ